MLLFLVVTVTAQDLLCFVCDARKENGVISRGFEECFYPDRSNPGNITVSNAGPNGTCVTTYQESEEDDIVILDIDRHFYPDEREDKYKNQKEYSRIDEVWCDPSTPQTWDLESLTKFYFKLSQL